MQALSLQCYHGIQLCNDYSYMHYCEINYINVFIELPLMLKVLCLHYGCLIKWHVESDLSNFGHF